MWASRTNNFSPKSPQSDCCVRTSYWMKKKKQSGDEQVNQTKKCCSSMVKGQLSPLFSMLIGRIKAEVNVFLHFIHRKKTKKWMNTALFYEAIASRGISWNLLHLSGGGGRCRLKLYRWFWWKTGGYTHVNWQTWLYCGLSNLYRSCELNIMLKYSLTPLDRVPMVTSLWTDKKTKRGKTFEQGKKGKRC